MDCYFDIYYRMHVANKGWLGWAKNGETAGTIGGRIQSEAIQIKLIAKNAQFNREGEAFYNLNASNNSKILNVNWNYISQVGKQVYDSCACHSIAYVRTILDGRVHDWKEFKLTSNPNNVNCSWSAGKMSSWLSMNSIEVYSKIYDCIRNDKPVVLTVSGGAKSKRLSNWHYVTVIGYENVSGNRNALNASNFIIIDPVKCTECGRGENLGDLGYDIVKHGNPPLTGYYEVFIPW